MVGGLADWFAVTALFRRPLGLPIPHTALIPTRKAQLGAQLGEFVTTNFLTPDNVIERLRVAHLVPSFAAQLATPESPSASAARPPPPCTQRCPRSARRTWRRWRSTSPVGTAAAGPTRRSPASCSRTSPTAVHTAPARRRTALPPYVDARQPRVLKNQLKDFGDKYGVLGMLITTDRRTGKLIDKTIASWPRSRPTRTRAARRAGRLAAQGRHDLQHDPRRSRDGSTRWSRRSSTTRRPRRGWRRSSAACSPRCARCSARATGR